jgi:signal transduction histidine kinase
LAACTLGEYELWGGARYDGAPVWPGPRLLDALLVIPLLTLPLLMRRRRPDGSCAVVLVGLLAFSTVFGGAESTTTFVLFIVAAYTAAAHARRPVPLLALTAATAAVHEARDPHVHGPGDVVWMLGMVAIACLVGWAVRTRTIRIGALETAAEAAARQHAEQLAEAARRERAVIARELHDVISHAVAVVVVQAQVGTRALPDGVEQAARALQTIEENARSAMAELRSLLTVLAESDQDVELRPAPSLARLDELVATFELAGLRIEREIDGQLPELDPVAGLAAYRVVQEALTNTVRHAPGAAVLLRVSAEEHGVRIRVADSGPSESGTPASPGAGRGLTGMRERLELAGGLLLAAEPEGRGFTVDAFVPARVRTGTVPTA